MLVITHKHEGICTLTLNQPPANCYSHQMMLELDRAILDARFDDDIHVIVITGTDKFFCAGADISMLGDVTSSFKYNFCLHSNETLMRLEQTPKLVVAAINGHCVGGGLEVALACDLRIAKRNSGKIGMPEVKLGVLPGTGGTARLTRLVGKSTAMELMISGRLLSFDDAQQLGIIHQTIDDNNFLQSAHAYAKKFTPPYAAPMAIAHIKRSIQSGENMSLSDHLALERELQQRLFDSSDAHEGILSYLEKRPAHFTGK